MRTEGATGAADETVLSRLVAEAESGDAAAQLKATARLKAAQESGDLLSPGLVARLLDLLPAFTDWESRLHVLQMLGGMDVPATSAEQLCDCLQSYITDKNKFIRAWAYSGFHRLASLFPDYRREVVVLLERGAADKAVSVRARLRQLPALDL